MSAIGDRVGYVVMEQSPNTGIWYAIPESPIHRTVSEARAEERRLRTEGATLTLGVAALTLVMISTDNTVTIEGDVR